MAQDNDRALRTAQLAEGWYPRSAGACSEALAQFERSCGPQGAASRVSAVVPHAGWAYSGAVAYRALRELACACDSDETLVLFAGHLSPGDAPTLMVAGDYWTPLGPIVGDDALAHALAESGSFRCETATRHTQDNATEVELPLIKHLMPKARLINVGVPPTEAALKIADQVLVAADQLGRRLRFVGSTDLTHYGPNYRWSPAGLGRHAERWVREENDPPFVAAAAALDARAMIRVAAERHNACCPGAAAAAVRCATRLGSAAGNLLDYRISCDVFPSDSFVGYAGIVF